MLMYVAAVVVIAASIAFVGIGTAYKWDTRSSGYGFWTRVVGAAAVVVLSLLSAISNRERPVLAAAIVVGGILLAWGYVALHRKLTDRINTMIQGDGRTL